MFAFVVFGLIFFTRPT